ncbi:MAG: O-antigen ligase family protein [Acidobacteriaceae bacterium]|jgi:O-antigen ligase
MGFVLSILYFITYYLTPAVIFGPLTAYRVELILAALVMLVSLPAFLGSFIGKTSQTLALIGLAFSVLMSVFVGQDWAGGGVNAFLAFIPNAFAYFLVCLHCNSKRRLQLIVLMLLFVCLFVIAQGSIDLLRAAPPAFALQPWMGSPYILPEGVGKSEWIFRLRGLGEINDPNDFGQLTVCVMPLVFIFWRKRAALRNSVFVLLPLCALLAGAFLTHSRGAMLAILAMVIVAMRRRIGTLPSLLIAGGMFVSAMALNFTGGRDISASAGSDRTSLWGAGLEMLKSHPLFGVGYNNFADYAGLTAHNSVVVCAAELGLVGLCFWALFLFSTVRDALVIASPAKVSEGEPIIPEKNPVPGARKIEALDKAEINRLGQLMVLSLTGFLVSGWFLSRSFVLTLFLLGGMVEAIFEMALRRGMIFPRLPLRRVVLYTGGLAASLVVFTYIFLRVANLSR